jgi:2-polyprenyl-3-methyl-5-hydroxy-6-metoxy-1,4-benzoquinol methylase
MTVTAIRRPTRRQDRLRKSECPLSSTDVLVGRYNAKNLVGVLESMPIERAMLDLFAKMTLAAGVEVADVGCGTGRLLPYLASRGLSPRGVDLSPRMVEVAQRENPGFAYEVADLRDCRSRTRRWPGWCAGFR